MSNTLNPNKVTASGSATGTLRNKVALKPGFSLVGWVRLTNSGEDLTGTKGKRFPVTLDELKKHNTKEDCWIAIRGKVYNITRYMDYHPGGVDELMRGAGIDATKLFDEYHAWVNIEQLLAKCFIGPLKNTVMLDFNPFESTKKPTNPPTLPPFKEESEEKELQVNIPTKVIPRFDWIQKAKDLTVYFYTKSFCNAGVALQREDDDKEYEVVVYIGNYQHTYKLSFLKPMKFPPKTFQVNQESGKIEITFEKVAEEVWINLGVFEKTKTLKSDNEEYPSWTECNIVRMEFFNHDSFELTLRPKTEKIILLPVGYHVCFKLEGVIRSYTAVPSNFLTNDCGCNPCDLNFLIKKYEQGSLSKHLTALNENIEILSVSQQKGSLDLNRLKDYTKFFLLAAGSGITPFLQLIPHLLGRNLQRVKTVHLLYFNKTADDIWCKEKFNDLSQTDERFKAKYILSEPNEEWIGETGRIRKNLIEEVDFDFVLVCGNSDFNQQSIKILDEFKADIHCFDG